MQLNLCHIVAYHGFGFVGELPGAWSHYRRADSNQKDFGLNQEVLSLHITYQNTENNLKALAGHQYKISPAARFERRFMLLVVALAGVVFFAVRARVTTVDILAFGGAAIIVLLGWLLLHRNFYIRRILQTHRNGEKRGFLGRVQTLDVTNAGLVAVSETGRSRLPYERIQRIDSAGECTFVYLNKASVLMLSKSATIEGDYYRFVDELKRQYARVAA